MSAAYLVRPGPVETSEPSPGAGPLHIRLLGADEAEAVSAPFRTIGWPKGAEIFEAYAREQARGERVVLVAWAGEAVAGHVTLVWRSDYRPFREAGTPEIKDFAVLPAFRRRRIGTRLMDEAERLAAARADHVGLGVGLSGDYGAAQQLYVLRGYRPDGQGLAWHGRTARRGQQVRVDDELNLYLVKRLRP
jgi:GNAT superfamily N-acetyltransferase